MNSMAVVRISLGRFDPENFEIIRALLDDSQTTLIPAIQKLSGNLGYYVGIDRENNGMSASGNHWAMLNKWQHCRK
jgi:hypothetical protein